MWVWFTHTKLPKPILFSNLKCSQSLSRSVHTTCRSTSSKLISPCLCVCVRMCLHVLPKPYKLPPHHLFLNLIHVRSLLTSHLTKVPQLAEVLCVLLTKQLITAILELHCTYHCSPTIVYTAMGVRCNLPSCLWGSIVCTSLYSRAHCRQTEGNYF